MKAVNIIWSVLQEIITIFIAIYLISTTTPDRFDTHVISLLIILYAAISRSFSVSAYAESTIAVDMLEELSELRKLVGKGMEDKATEQERVKDSVKKTIKNNLPAFYIHQAGCFILFFIGLFGLFA